MALRLEISLGGIVGTNRSSITECIHISGNESIDNAINVLRRKSEPVVAESRLFGWGGLKTWLDTHRQAGACIVIDADVMKLGNDAKACICSTQSHVSWVATISLTDLVSHRDDVWLNQWSWCIPTMTHMNEVDKADRALNRQSAAFDATDCQVIRQVQSQQLKTWLNKVWDELGELQPVVTRLAQVSDHAVQESERERVLDELGLYKIGKGNWTPLALLLMSYVRVNHCQGGWLHEARCGQFDDFMFWLRRLANDAYHFFRRIGTWIILALMLILGVYVVFSEFDGLTNGLSLQLAQLIRLLLGAILIAAAFAIGIRTLRTEFSSKYVRKVLFISLLLVLLPMLQETFTFLLDRPIDIPTLTLSLLIFAAAVALLIGVFPDEI